MESWLYLLNDVMVVHVMKVAPMVVRSCSLALLVVAEVLAEQVEVPVELEVLMYSCRLEKKWSCCRRCLVVPVALDCLEELDIVEVVVAEVQVEVVLVVDVAVVVHRRCC